MSDYMEKHLSKLVGYTVIGIIKDDFDDTLDEYGEPLFALILEKNGKQLMATILSDAEGNGAGHLDIVKYEPVHEIF